MEANSEPRPPSPLLEADPKVSMQRVMSTDPEEVTREDRDKIVAELRKARVDFIAQEKMPKAKKEKSTPAPKNLTLADLGLE